MTPPQARELTLGEPANRVPDLAGPQVTSWAGLLRGGICGPAIGALRVARCRSPATAPSGRAVCCYHPGTPWAAGLGAVPDREPAGLQGIASDVTPLEIKDACHYLAEDQPAAVIRGLTAFFS